jgi:ribonuclease PH
MDSSLNGKRRRDGRNKNDIRPMLADFNVIEASDGSCRLQCGNTQVITSVYGPRPVRMLKLEDPEKALLDITVIPDSGNAKSKESYIKVALFQILSSLIVLKAYPRTAISITVQIVHDDGSLLSTIINCVHLALADASISQYGFVCSATIGLVNNRHAKAESNEGTIIDLISAEEVDVASTGCFAFTSYRKPVDDADDAMGDDTQPAGLNVDCVFLSMKGVFSPKEVEIMRNEAYSACESIFSFQKLALKEKIKRLHLNV